MKNKFELSEFYFLKAIDNNFINSMYGLGSLYESLNRNYDAEKYYQMAIRNGHYYSFIRLNNLLEKI
jgi:hypothetical protein